MVGEKGAGVDPLKNYQKLNKQCKMCALLEFEAIAAEWLAQTHSMGYGSSNLATK